LNALSAIIYKPRNHAHTSRNAGNINTSKIGNLAHAHLNPKKSQHSQHGIIYSEYTRTQELQKSKMYTYQNMIMALKTVQVMKI